MQRLVFCLCLILCWAGTGLAAVQAPGAGPERTEADLGKLSGSIDRLADILGRYSEDRAEDLKYRKLEIAVAYLNFRSRRIEDLEMELQSLKSARVNTEDALNTWKQRRETVEAKLRDNPQRPKEELERTFEEYDMRIRMVEKRYSNLETEIITLENRIVDLRGQLDDVERFVRENLDL